MDAGCDVVLRAKLEATGALKRFARDDEIDADMAGETRRFDDGRGVNEDGDDTPRRDVGCPVADSDRAISVWTVGVPSLETLQAAQSQAASRGAVKDRTAASVALTPRGSCLTFRRRHRLCTSALCDGDLETGPA